MTTSGGNERNRSTTAMIAQLSGRTPRLRSRARASPAAIPVTTTRRASSIVTTTPDRMSGRYLSMTLPLKNVSAKRSQRDTSVPLDLADEAAGALLRGALEDRGGPPLLHDRALVPGPGPGRRASGQAHPLAGHQPGHGALAEGAH